jgi:hypothetical protein
VEDLNPVVPDVDLPHSEVLEVALPMVSFCDTPMSASRRHLTAYGPFGIGMTKAWGLQRGLTPVLYAHSRSSITGTLFAAAVRAHRGRQGAEGDSRRVWDDTQKDIGHVLDFTKPYEGRLWRNGVWLPAIRFYDEREWRWVPGGRRPKSLTRAEWSNSDTLREAQREAWGYGGLDFTPSDIRYLIVAEERDIPPLIDSFPDAWPNADRTALQILSTRILTTAELFKDL